LADLPPIPILTRRDYIDRLLAGGYPEARTLPPRARRTLYRDIVDSVVDRDVADLLEIRKTERLRRLIDQLAARTATTLNVTDLAGTVGLSRPPVDAYLDVLIRLSLIHPLGAWAPGESKREVRQPKVHFADSGIVGALRRLVPESFDADAQPAALGGLLESFAVNEILRALPLQEEDIAAYHWRSRDGHEIDLILEGATGLAGVEIKASSSVDDSDFRHLDRFAATGPAKGRRVTKIVLFLGERALSFGPGRVALPISCLWAG
jgi:predicted AAA+ superfamily ATPase